MKPANPWTSNMWPPHPGGNQTPLTDLNQLINDSNTRLPASSWSNNPTHWLILSSRSCRPVNDLAEVILSVLLSNQTLSTVGRVTAVRALNPSLARGSRATARSLWCWWRGSEIVHVSLSGSRYWIEVCWSQNINFNEWNMISTLFSWWFVRKMRWLSSSRGVTPPLWPWHVTWPWHVLFQWGSA